MALSAGSKATFTDINSVKTAIHNAYSKVHGTAPTWSNFPSGAGVKITAATITELNSKGYSAAQYWVSSRAGDSPVHGNSGCSSNCENVSSGGFGRAFRYNGKCGGEAYMWHTVGHNFPLPLDKK